APGRLDVMGGIADYSGSLVLQRTTAEATFAAVQPTERGKFEITSLGNPSRQCDIDLEDIAPGGEPIRYEKARESFAGSERKRWASYIVGVILVLMRERHVSLTHGARILIGSGVPEAKGVASSAALEVAVMQGVRAGF